MTVFFTRSSRRKPRDDAVRIAPGVEASTPCGGTTEPISGRIVNAGRQGVYLETDHCLEPGTRVSIEIVPPGEPARRAVYKVRRGKVIWCRRLGAGRKRHYGAGIEILERVLQAEIPIASLV